MIILIEFDKTKAKITLNGHTHEMKKVFVKKQTLNDLILYVEHLNSKL